MQRQTGKAGTTGKVLAGLLAGMLSLGATAARAEYCHAIGLDSCPTGATQFCSDNPIRPTDFYQALGACQTCFGVQCFQLPFGTSALTPDRNDFTCNNTFFFWEDSGGSAGSSGSRCYGYPQGSWSDPPACFDGLPSPGEERTDCGGPCTDTPCCNADGVVDAGREDCDDGNAVDGDGCTSCHVDGCYACGGSPSACTVTTGASCADDGNACTLDQCDASAQCVHPANTGAACDDDGNGCTLDRCDATGTCAHDGDIGAACADDGNACTLDQCDASGACVHPAVADGAACDDDSLCTNDDHCSAGTCTGTDTVVCCDGGTCMPDTGACSICPDGYTQDGSYFCSKTYSITAGDLDDVAYTCNPNEAIGLASIGFHWTDPGDPAVGAALDFAIDMGSSYLSTGSSKHVDVQLNGNAIGGYDAAQFESCVGEPINRRFSNLNSAYYTKGATNQVVASWVGSGHGLTADGSGHYAAVTVKYLATPQTPLSDGTACDDGNACTLGDACHAGACNGTNLTCEASDACHLAGTCNPTTGECSNPAALDNLPCDDGNACTYFDTCQAGTCTAGTTETCPPADACHETGTCNPATGACSNPERPDGSPCPDDSDECTLAQACQDGVCTVTNRVTCGPAPDQCHGAGLCQPLSGLCDYPPLPDYSPCNDDASCTTPDYCMGGTCQGSPKADGSYCDDGNPCTFSETCQAGACGGGVPLVCKASDECHTPGTCDPATGCAQIPIACDDGSVCTDDSCDPASGCTFEPAIATGCRSAQSKFGYSTSDDDTKDKMKWSWGGAATALADIADPTTTADYRLCVFASLGGVPSVFLAAEVPASSLWQAAGKRGYKYSDKPGDSDGITTAQLQSSDTGNAKLKIAGKGTGLGDPMLPLGTSLSGMQVQLTNLSTGICWGAEFTPEEIRQDEKKVSAASE